MIRRFVTFRQKRPLHHVFGGWVEGVGGYNVLVVCVLIYIICVFFQLSVILGTSKTLLMLRFQHVLGTSKTLLMLRLQRLQDSASL